MANTKSAEQSATERQAREDFLRALPDGTWFLVVPDARGDFDPALGGHETESGARKARNSLRYGGIGSTTERVTIHRGSVTTRRRKQ